MSKKRHSKLPLLLAVFIALIIFFAIGTGFYLSPQSDPKKSDAIVVVSGGQTTTRAQKGIELYKQGLAPLIIFSGAAMDDGPSNATAMRAQAIKAGVATSAIRIDEASKNTYENAVNTNQLLEKSQAKQIILISSPYHLRRTKMTFEKILGPEISVLPVASFDNRWSKATWWSNPFGLQITLSELFKVFYITVTGNYR